MATFDPNTPIELLEATVRQRYSLAQGVPLTCSVTNDNEHRPTMAIIPLIPLEDSYHWTAVDSKITLLVDRGVINDENP